MEKYVYNRESLPCPVFPAKPEWVELYYRAWELAFQNVEYIEQEGWKPQLTCMPGVNTIWQWDSCLMVFVTNYANGTISALNNLDNLYRLRRESDGYMSMAYRILSEQPAWPGRINPPLMAWAEWEQFCISGDASRFSVVLPALEGNYRFIEENRRRSCGLYWFEDPGSSGMDNAPRGPYGAGSLDGSGICHVDLACQQALSAKCMAKMFAYLGEEEKAAFYRHEQERINGLINRYHWHEKAGWYFDFFARGSAELKVKYINSKTAAAFWAILCGAAEGQRLEHMISHMYNPAEFYGTVPFSSLSADDLNFDPDGGYWLGGVWAPTNYAAIRGLTEVGRGTLAREAAMRYLEAISQVANDSAYGNTIWECYSPTSYRPATAEAGEIVRADFVGWSGLAPVAMLIENIMGFRFEADSNTVRFDLFPGQMCGIKNLCFNHNRIGVVCTGYRTADGQSVLEVSAEHPFILKVKTNYAWGEKTISVPAGEHTFYV